MELQHLNELDVTEAEVDTGKPNGVAIEIAMKKDESNVMGCEQGESQLETNGTYAVACRNTGTQALPDAQEYHHNFCCEHFLRPSNAKVYENWQAWRCWSCP